VSLAGQYDLVIFDLDGVVYLGGEPVPGAPQAIASIVDSAIAVAYATNNASRRATEVATLLRSLGVPAGEDEVLTSAQAAAALLAEDLPPGAPVLVVGATALVEEVRAVGLTPVVAGGDVRGAAVAVVQGYGANVGWADLAEACVAVRAGARWVATNTDATLPSPRGPLPGNGSLVAALATALGRGPDTVVGKPSPALFEVAARRRGAERALVVGDRLDTDVEGAVRAGMDSLLVLTGVSTAADLLRAGPGERPTHVAADTRALSTEEDFSRVPGWEAERRLAQAGPWQAGRDDERLVLARNGGPGPADDPVAALRALAAAAWSGPWREIAASDAAAAGALASLGLG
jgi:HAD superfamily hydrolase (TIGR01450 family)